MRTLKFIEKERKAKKILQMSYSECLFLLSAIVVSVICGEETEPAEL